MLNKSITPDELAYELSLMTEALEFVRETLYTEGLQTQKNPSVGLGYLVGLLADRTQEVTNLMPEFKRTDHP